MHTSKIPWRFAFLKITVWLSKGEYLQSFALERQTGTRPNFTTTKETESGGLSDVYAATSGSRMLKAETAPSRHHLEAPQKGDNRLLGKRAPWGEEGRRQTQPVKNKQGKTSTQTPTKGFFLTVGWDSRGLRFYLTSPRTGGKKNNDRIPTGCPFHQSKKTSDINRMYNSIIKV